MKNAQNSYIEPECTYSNGWYCLTSKPKSKVSQVNNIIMESKQLDCPGMCTHVRNNNNSNNKLVKVNMTINIMYRFRVQAKYYYITVYHCTQRTQEAHSVLKKKRGYIKLQSML